MSKFEGVQQQVLLDEFSNQLVSAGAGSGKTTIMIEKLANLIINQGVNVDNLLVVTFTVLSAGEMKERLVEKLKDKLNDSSVDKTKILQLIEDVKTASIDTIDGFSSKTIKKYFYKLDISPNIEIVSDNTRDYYLTRAMKKTIKDFEKNTDKVNLFIDLFGGNRRNLDAVEDMLISNYYNVINLDDYEAFLIEAENEYKDSIKSEKFLNDVIVKNVDTIKKQIIYNISLFESPIQNTLKDFVCKLESFNKNLNLISNLNQLYSLEFPKFSAKEYSNNIGLKELILDVKVLKELKEKLEKNCINENFEEKNAKILEYLPYFIDLLKNFIKNYNSLKNKNNVIDFNDLNRLMLKLLSFDDVKNELQNKYRYIFVDECQDINPLQDKLINSLVGASTKLFMVGDVKQSIYGFRGASPELFLNKYKNLKADNSMGMAYDMNVNFRSSPKVLNFVNQVFEKLMTEQSADINYKQDAMIEPKRDDIINGKVKLTFVNSHVDKTVATGIYSVKNDSANVKDITYKSQALVVLKTITELIGSEFYDAKLNKIRRLTYGDIAILVRGEKDDACLNLITLLKDCNIPLNVNNKLDIESSEGIKLILSILKCVNKTADDVDYLSTFMTLTDLTIDDIVKIRNKEKSLFENLIDNIDIEEIKFGFEVLEKIKNASYTRTNSCLIRYILNDLKLKYFFLRMENGDKELNKIEEFLNKISLVEDGLGLSEFVEVIESNVSKSSDFNTQDKEDSVTIQTIHKSKGLEYPVVILYNASKTFSYLTEHDGINFDADLGLGFDYFDTVERTKSYSLTKFAINLKNREKGYKEELRLLYVAFTRAKNQLYVIGSYSPNALKDKEFNKTSFGNMLLNCFADVVEEGFVSLKNCDIELIDNVEEFNAVTESKNQEIEMYKEFNYPHQDKFNIPLKNSVTSLNSQMQEYKVKVEFKTDRQYQVQEDLALKGTHYHTALEKLDYLKPYEQITNFEDVDYEKIKKAHQVLGELIKNSVNHYKEEDFEMYVPYCEVANSDIHDKVLIQGVVDLIIERENYIDIVDYKFSNLKIGSLKQKYFEQLNLYKKAVENAFAKPVKNTFIYSINSGELL